MGGAACVIIINGNKAYGVVEDFAENNRQVNVSMLEAAIEASCNVTPYASLSLQINDQYLDEIYTQPIIDIHNRIINELPMIEKSDAQKLVDELTSLLFAASETIVNAFGAEIIASEEG